jgi:hypothetical protein
MEALDCKEIQERGASDEDLELALFEAVEDGGLADDHGVCLAHEVRTFEDAGVMTYQRGLVIRTCEGSEFQVTIVRSR